MKRLLIALSFSLPCLGLAVTCLVPRFTATYQISAHGLSVGTLTQRYHQKQGFYLLASEATTRILLMSDILHEQTTGAVGPTGVKPNLYQLSSQNKGLIERIDFNRKANQLVSIVGNTRKFFPIKPGLQDNLSYQLQLRYNLIKHNKAMGFNVINDNKVQHYQFKVVAKQVRLKTPARTLMTIELRSNPNAQGQRITYWFAPHYDYLLVKSMTSKAGKPSAQAVLSSYQINGTQCQ